MSRKANRPLVPLYLIACYAYYVEDDPIMSDAEFDKVVTELEAKWDSIEHPHKHLLDRAFLKSGFHITYPAIVRGATAALRAELTRRRR